MIRTVEKHSTPAVILVFLATLLLNCSISFAQSSTATVPGVDQRIVDAHGVEWVQNMKQLAPYQLEYLAFMCDHGHYVASHPTKDDYEPTSLSEAGKNTMNLSADDIPAFDINNPDEFNILLWNVVRPRSTRAVYRIDGTDQALILLSQTELMAKYQAQKGGQQ